MNSEWLSGHYIVPTEEVRTCGDMGWNRNAVTTIVRSLI